MTRREARRRVYLAAAAHLSSYLLDNDTSLYDGMAYPPSHDIMRVEDAVDDLVEELETRAAALLETREEDLSKLRSRVAELEADRDRREDYEMEQKR